jgi:hypothetical protein
MYTLQITRWLEAGQEIPSTEDMSPYSLWDYLPDDSPTEWDTIEAAEAAADQARTNPDVDGIAPDCVVIETV